MLCDAHQNRQMSRLTFVETPFDDNDDVESDSEYQNIDGVENGGGDDANISLKTEIESDEIDTSIVTDLVDDTSLKKKKKKKKKKPISVNDKLLDVVPTPNVIATGWLASFLTKKRSNEISPPPDIAVSNDTYLAEFSHQFDKPQKEVHDSVESDVEVQNETIVTADLELKDGEMTVGEESSLPLNSKLSFYNLPYSITEQEVWAESLC